VISSLQPLPSNAFAVTFAVATAWPRAFLHATLIILSIALAAPSQIRLTFSLAIANAAASAQWAPQERGS
jgi:hypothetical protein